MKRALQSVQTTLISIKTTLCSINSALYSRNLANPNGGPAAFTFAAEHCNTPNTLQHIDTLCDGSCCTLICCITLQHTTRRYTLQHTVYRGLLHSHWLHHVLRHLQHLLRHLLRHLHVHRHLLRGQGHLHLLHRLGIRCLHSQREREGERRQRRTEMRVRDCERESGGGVEERKHEK